LYEDDGVSYGYENGAFSEIPLSYDDATATLTIGDRSGEYPGMLSERTFQVVLVAADSPVGFDLDTPPPAVEVSYDGSAREVALR
jgi:alpha-D-xyloside xylohydrolase